MADSKLLSLPLALMLIVLVLAEEAHKRWDLFEIILGVSMAIILIMSGVVITLAWMTP